MGELRLARARIDQHVGDQLHRRVVDDVGHACRFRGGDGEFAVGAHAHALGLDADRDLGKHVAALDVHDGDETVVLVGDVDLLAVRIDRHQLGVGTRFELAALLKGLGVDHVHDVAVAGGHEQLLEVGAEHDAARARATL